MGTSTKAGKELGRVHVVSKQSCIFVDDTSLPLFLSREYCLDVLPFPVSTSHFESSYDEISRPLHLDTPLRIADRRSPYRNHKLPHRNNESICSNNQLVNTSRRVCNLAIRKYSRDSILTSAT